jgi:hypothetical protein
MVSFRMLMSMVWSIVSKQPLRSPSRNHLVPVPVCLISPKAMWHPRSGRKPCEWSLNCGSSYTSRMSRITSCSNVADHVGMPSGRTLPFCFGIDVLLTGVHRERSSRTKSLSFLIFSRDISSTVSLVVPLGIAPLLEYSRAYARRDRSGWERRR